MARTSVLTVSDNCARLPATAKSEVMGENKVTSDKPDLAELAASFAEVARLAGVHIKPQDLRIEWLPAPHRRPGSLPHGEQAVYVFMLGQVCLDRARLVQSIGSHHHERIEQLDVSSVGAWLETNASRAHFFLPCSAGGCVLGLLESFLQCRLRPIYEGKKSGVA